MPLNQAFSDWRDRRVWVIGASTGIGAALAQQLLTHGARVGLSARRRDKLEVLAASAAPGQAVIAPLDITDLTSVKAASELLLHQWGGFDLVLIVAGTHVEMRAQTWDLAAARQLIDTNLIGVLHCVDVVLPTLQRQAAGGIGIVSSVAGYIGLPRALIYGASKAALINFAESLYGDLQPQGINVYLINPGFVDTPLTQKNDFSMPALMSPNEAARQTLKAMAAGCFEIHYPKRFTRWLKLLRVLPYPLQFWLVRKVTGG